MNRTRISAALLTGVLLASVPAVPVQADGIHAGITSVLAEYLASKTAVYQSVGILPVTEAAFSASLKETTGSAQEGTAGSALEDAASAASEEAAAASAVCGYTNLGVANVESNLNIREGAGEDQKLVGKLPRDAGCEILETVGEWYKISSGEVTGYVKAEYVLTGEAARARAMEVKYDVATISASAVNLRVEPNTECSVVTTVPKGEELDLIEVVGDWVKVELDGDTCYVLGELVNLSEQLPKALTMTEVRYGQGVSDVRVDLVNYACQFIGNRYVWGGTSLTRGVDCSGFTMKVYEKYGISLPHNASAQSQYGTRISISQAKPGDLIFYSKGGRINHVALYIGNGQVVHASSPKSGIKVSSYNYRTPTKIIRLIND